MDIKKLFMLLGGVVFFGLVLLMFTGDSGSSHTKKSRSDQLSSLLGGGSGDSMDPGSVKRGQRIKSNSSIFDSDFDKAGVNTNFSEEETPVAKESDGIAPINPQTQKPYDDKTMEEFDKLRLIFPGNELIPKKFSKEEKAKKDQEDSTYAQAMTAFMNNTANKGQVQVYFSKQEKVIKDRLEIVEYLIDVQKEDGEYDKDGQFQKILDGAKEQLKSLETQRDEAYRKYGL